MKPHIIRFTCGECRAKLKSAIEEAGTTCECPKCGKPTLVPFPGIGRWQFLMCFLVWAAVATFARKMFNSEVPWLLANLLILVPACASRLINIGNRAAWCWLCMVPIVGLLVAVRCLTAPSGYAQRKKIDRQPRSSQESPLH